MITEEAIEAAWKKYRDGALAVRVSKTDFLGGFEAALSTLPIAVEGKDAIAQIVKLVRDRAYQPPYSNRMLELADEIEALQFSSPGKDGGQEVEAAQITMGRGLVDVSRIEHEGRAGILFRPRDDHIPVGEEGELQPGEYWPVKGDVVIWIENEGGARVIETYLSAFLPYQPDSTALVERLTKALEPFAKEAGCYDPDTGDGDDTVWATPVYFKIRDLREARNALSSSQSTSTEGER